MKRVRQWGIVAVLFLCSCVPGARYTLNEANDIFKPTKNRDVNFTQGLRFGAEIPDATGSHSYYAQHLFYTPIHKRLSQPLPDERPYAGYLAGGYKASYRRGMAANVFGVETGIVGPHAYGKEVQREFHRLLGQSYPQGWDHQLDDVAVATFTGERVNRFVFVENLDLITTLGANIGNLFDQASGSGTMRFGSNLPDYLIGGPIYPRNEREERSPLRAYGFATGLVRAVAYNRFLGDLERKPLVGEGRIGFTVEWDSYHFTYQYIAQTKEFETEDRGMDWGDIQLGVVW